jgi:hypothetical protein
MCPPFFFQSFPSHHEIVLHDITLTSLFMIVISLKYVNYSLRTHLFNTVQELFAEYFEKILQAYA